MKRIQNLFQISLWILFYFIFYHAFAEEFKVPNNHLTQLVYTLIFIGYIILSILNIRVLFRQLFLQRRYILHIFLMLCIITIYSWIANLLVFHTLDVNLGDMDKQHSSRQGFFLIFGLIYVGMGSFFRILEYGHSLRENLVEYEKDKIEAELTTLKAQINPHLLFNTLNSIYSKSLDKSDATPEMILKLSDLMSYVLYDCKKETVALKNEIDFIQNYIDLEQMRFEDKNNLHYKLDVDRNDIEIAPLLLLPFIENAFKHSGSSPSKKSEITFTLHLSEDCVLEFEATNSVALDKDEVINPRSGIGISNITKRLEYLYPGKHKLHMDSGKDRYTVNLKLQLA